MQFKEYSHQFWMAKALKAISSVFNEVPVCALVVKDNQLISKATNKTESYLDATAHAEILAIREASKVLGNWRLENCTLYVTLEPCSMCAGAIINSRISKLVFGAYDLRQDACGSVINLFKEMNKLEQIEVIGGILEFEASKVIKKFFLEVRHA